MNCFYVILVLGRVISIPMVRVRMGVFRIVRDARLLLMVVMLAIRGIQAAVLWKLARFVHAGG